MIKSARVKYRRFESSDLDSYLRIISNQEVMKHISGYPFDPVGGKKRFEKALAINDKDQRFGYFAVMIEQEIVGLNKIVFYDENRVEVGYSLLPSFWGRGLATEMIAAMETYIKEIEPDKTLIATVQPENIGSIKALEKNQFKETGTDSIDNVKVLIYEKP